MTLRQGDIGDSVKSLQPGLNKLGSVLRTDRDFDFRVYTTAVVLDAH
jgi:hypothetical protein